MCRHLEGEKIYRWHILTLWVGGKMCHVTFPSLDRTSLGLAQRHPNTIRVYAIDYIIKTKTMELPYKKKLFVVENIQSISINSAIRKRPLLDICIGSFII